MRVGWEGWSVEVNDLWAVTDHPECLTLEISSESALQFSSALKKNGNVTEQDLHGFVEKNAIEWGAFSSVSFGEFRGICVQYIENGTQWARWFLMNQRTVLFVTYNGTSEAHQNEYTEVNQLLSTIRVEAAP